MKAWGETRVARHVDRHRDMQEAEVEEEVCAREFTARLKELIEADKGTLPSSAGSPSSMCAESDPAASASTPSSAEASLAGHGREDFGAVVERMKRRLSSRGVRLQGGPAESHHPRAGAADTNWPAASELIDEKASLRKRDIVFSASSDGRARARACTCAPTLEASGRAAGAREHAGALGAVDDRPAPANAGASAGVLREALVQRAHVVPGWRWRRG
eukprot:CAMPEP_0176246308 /NCGR_PEP_ID=MMETSP0121_2-20121125/32381_1 /TAXON_ID=160619 /ORGANISM="Kryptoperidinium foliaceum, Strain CCMP 1326" /LENGTH=216 /DNA_ID=CAMNT_0017585945 /DNA_START=73 /DNA_END=721 /DNA_ORIENTATION=+